MFSQFSTIKYLSCVPRFDTWISFEAVGVFVLKMSLEIERDNVAELNNSL